MFRTVSQTGVHYRMSALSEGKAGRVRGGDRLPWVESDATAGGSDDNYSPLTSLEWQAHVYGVPSEAIRLTCRESRLPLHEFPWGARPRRAGLQRDALYLVRPDGYVGLATKSEVELAAYLRDWRIGG
jgi:hypothetical protein